MLYGDITLKFTQDLAILIYQIIEIFSYIHFPDPLPLQASLLIFPLYPQGKNHRSHYPPYFLWKSSFRYILLRRVALILELP